MTDTGEQAKIRILVLDEQPLLREGISAYLNSQPDMVVCGEAESTCEAWSKIAQRQPQVVVTPLRIGVGDCLTLIKKLKAENAELRILVYSAFEETLFAERAMRAGANGYVMKQAPRENLAAAIRDIAQGDIYVSRKVALNAYRKSLQRRNDHIPESATSRDLSDREIHVFQLLGSGLGRREIAGSLDLSVKTVETHQENIKHKLQLRSCAELRACAAKWVERSLNTEEHLFGGTTERKETAPSTAVHVVEPFDTQQRTSSYVAADPAASVDGPAFAPVASHAIAES